MKMWKKISHQRKYVPLLSLLMILGCQEAPPNNPPEISELIIYPSQPKTGQMVLLTGIADDEDGDEVTYRWIASGGTFVDSLGANPIQWQAPTKSDSINIFLHVSDQEATTIETHSFFLEAGLGNVAGHVSDVSSEFKIEGVVVNLNGSEVTTGSDGYFQFTDVETGENIPLSASAPNYVTYADFINVSVDENILDIPMILLTEIGSVVGYVSDSRTGTKLEGVVVETGTISSTTGVDGYFELSNVAISANVPIRAVLDGYEIFSVMIDVASGYNTNDIALVPNIATVSGRITAESDGSLLSGVVVTINQYQDTTNVSGYFEIVDIPVMSNASVSAVLDGYITSHTSLDIVGGTNNLNMALNDNPGYLTGWVRSTLDGSALSAATVVVGSTPVTTINDGSYIISGLEPGPILVSCNITGYEAFTMLDTIEAGANALDIDMVQMVGSLSGFVRDSLENNSLSGLTILLGNETTNSEADGFFEFENIDVGQYQLTLTEENYQDYSILVTVEAGENTQNIQLITSTATVLGLVKDVDSEVVIPGVTVRIGESSVDTDEYGYFELTSIDLGARTINGEVEGYIDFSDTLTVNPGENIFNINMGSSVASVSGVVTNTSDGSIIAGAVLAIGDLLDTTGVDGYYRFEGIDLGATSIAVERSGFETRTVPIEVLAGENINNIELSSNLGSLMGYVSNGGNGENLDSVRVICGVDTVYTNVDGFYLLDSLSLGSNSFSFGKPGFFSHAGWTTIVSGANVLDVTLSSDSGNLIGYIRNSNTLDLIDSVMVYFQSDSVLTGVDGRYEFLQVPVAEQYNFRARKAGFQDHQQWVDVLAGDNIVDVNLVPSN